MLTQPTSMTFITQITLLIAISACSRSPLQGAGNADCDSGDRVIINERLFCVFEESRETRPVQSSPDGMAGDLVMAGEPVLAGEPNVTENDPTYCPSITPIAYRYETLTICAEEQVNSLLIEAVVAQWSTDYAESDEGPSPEVIVDASISDEIEPVGIPLDLGVSDDD